ncbi:MAG TPA: glycosyltransferase family 39 protein [Candidatus Acidoferrales bacterium]|nr:glycosyltransferase family 39 protein [Candidatus Acidoferrales bacterium]
MFDFISFKRRRNLWAALGAAFTIVVCLFSNLGAIGLLGPDEPRYAWIARAMAETGDWVTPRLYGQPWFEKPVLYYWAAGLGFRLHLPSEWAARLPSALAAFVAVLAIGWFAWRHYGEEGGFVLCPALLAPMLFSTSVAAIAFSRAATPDMLFASSLALSMAFAAGVLRRSGALRTANASAASAQSSDIRHLTLFGASIGIALLAKGPASILLAGGALGLWALLTNQWRAARRLVHPIAIASFAVVGLPWYILCAVRNPDFLRVFILQHNFERYLTPVFQHIQPIWFFVPITIAAKLPWAIFFVPAGLEGWRIFRQKTWKNSPGVFLFCWVFFPIFFFSFSQSKLPSYVLPAFPALSVICSLGAIRRFNSTRSMPLVLAAGLAAVWIVAAFAVHHFVSRLPADWLEQAPFRLSADVIIFLAFLVGALLIYCAYRRSLVLTVALSSLAVISAVLYSNFRVLPAFDPMYSARWHEAYLSRDLHADRIFTFGLKRGWNYGLAFYFKRHLPEWNPEDPAPALVLTTPKGFHKIESLGRFRGSLDEPHTGIVYVPVYPLSVNHRF